ncbi:MAG: hypothetical protein IH591_12485 [Bacteroidales bacterium]|nr:hypothetical protein [Bacteroidales bacterium]
MKIIILIFAVLFVLNLDKEEKIYYIPNIPGKQMAATIPPFGIFIEEKYRNEGDFPGSIISHERIHWNVQYKEMGLLKFYYNYASIYVKHGRINNWMEEEARTLCIVNRQ